MKRGEFYINGVSSQKWNMYIQHRPTRIAAVRSFSDATVTNRSGTVFRDQGIYLNSELELELVFLKQLDDSLIDEISDLFNLKEYADFIAYYDDKYTYRVMITEPIEFFNSIDTGKATTAKIKFSVYPFKFLNSTLYPIESRPNLKLFNYTKIEAKPRITLIGSGNLKFSINDKEYNFKNVQNEFWLDSLDLSTSRSGIMQELDFPILEIGWNKIICNADYKIIPRLMRRVS